MSKSILPLISPITPGIRAARALKRYWPLYLMLIPGILFFLIYKIAPMFGILIAFKKFAIKKGIFFSPWAEPWYYHFQYFFISPENVRIVTNTLLLSSWKLVAGMFPPLLFALAVGECRSRPMARTIQTVSYLPHFLSWAVVYGICMTMLSETNGVINGFLEKLGGQSIPFLNTNRFTIYNRSVVIPEDYYLADMEATSRCSSSPSSRASCLFRSMENLCRSSMTSMIFSAI